MHNDEFFQFFTRVYEMIVELTPAKLNIEKLFAEFQTVYAQLDEAMRKIFQSALTQRIADADAARDEVFRGLVNTYTAALSHFDTTIRNTALRLQPPFRAYGNLAKKPNNEKTSAIYNFCKDLTEKYPDEVDALGLGPWLDKLTALNRATEALMMERIDEAAARTDLVMSRVRIEMKQVWYRLADRLDALELIFGEDEGAPWAALIEKLNGITTQTENIVAVRRGRAAAGKKKEEGEDN